MLNNSSKISAPWREIATCLQLSIIIVFLPIMRTITYYSISELHLKTLWKASHQTLKQVLPFRKITPDQLRLYTPSILTSPGDILTAKFVRKLNLLQKCKFIYFMAPVSARVSLREIVLWKSSSSTRGSAAGFSFGKFFCWNFGMMASSTDNFSRYAGSSTGNSNLLLSRTYIIFGLFHCPLYKNCLKGESSSSKLQTASYLFL